MRAVTAGAAARQGPISRANERTRLSGSPASRSSSVTRALSAKTSRCSSSASSSITCAPAASGDGVGGKARGGVIRASGGEFESSAQTLSWPLHSNPPPEVMEDEAEELQREVFALRARPPKLAGNRRVQHQLLELYDGGVRGGRGGGQLPPQLERLQKAEGSAMMVSARPELPQLFLSRQQRRQTRGVKNTEHKPQQDQD
ncbi:hypothetical protein TSOC_008451 [Tetrabaena socialis]|uniref:Uncharacterized protein n=1 Tax=Tetrabaena socialis TaxID=47790 RepID=A0A2J7ZYC3_9CHLO|nr:hypothetical protein TSOC_008451 [Tetrabaena socialis]|eukprot:PNH05274.1 hypothetical protein TSOC_008451 [Tetrabaena socialis]